MNRTIFLIGLNHKTANVAIRERFALADSMAFQANLKKINNILQEVVILSTCNRVEILGVGNADAPQQVLNEWAKHKDGSATELCSHVYTYQGIDAVRHLFNVASSLDSLVVGEPQILGQLKTAYKNALENKLTGTVLNKLVHKAFSVAKRVRTETGIATNAVSISYAAVELAKKIFGEMSQYQAMLIGAGEMAELAAANLMKAGINKIFIANRTYERALELAQRFNGQAVPFESLFEQLPHVDIVISSTGAQEAIIHAKDIKNILKIRKQRPMFFIDIAMPRDIDPDVNTIDNVYLYDIDDLKDVVEENQAQRRDEAFKASNIVDCEALSFNSWLRSLDLQPTIVDILQRSEKIIKEELCKTLKKFDNLTLEQEESLQCMLASIVKKINHEPITFLKRRFEEEEAGNRYISVARRMFNLDNEIVPEDAHETRRKKYF